MMIEKPALRPQNPRFSSGPCAKIPGWSAGDLTRALTGHSHRSAPGKARLKQAIALTREVLEVPPSHLVAIVPASDTGAVEMTPRAPISDHGADSTARVTVAWGGGTGGLSGRQRARAGEWEGP